MTTKGTAQRCELQDQGSRPHSWPPGADPKEHGLLGDSPALLTTIWRAYRAARSRYHVVLRGETGTGKELVAHYIHRCSGRRGAMRVLNCANLTPDLAASHLFGHVRGAFTGAANNERGYFKLADKGTLFLDEIGELDLRVQAMLLRVLSEGTFTPVGGREEERADVCIVSASHADLQELVARGRFREDLYHRLAQVHIEVPALRDRPEDIIPIAHGIVSRLSPPDGRPPWVLTDEAAQLLVPHPWPGNVRDLCNTLRASSLEAVGGRIEPQHLPLHLQPATSPRPAPPVLARRRLLERLAVGAATASQLVAELGLSEWQVKSGLRQLRADGLVRLHGAGPASWYSLATAREDAGPPPGPAVEAALRLAAIEPGVTSRGLQAELGGSLATARRVLQALTRAGRLFLANPGGREGLYRLSRPTGSAAGSIEDIAARSENNKVGEGWPKARLPALPARAPPSPAAEPAPPTLKLGPPKQKPSARPASPPPARPEQRTVDEASLVALKLVEARGRVTRAMLVEATGASTSTAGRALSRLVAEGRLRPGEGRGNQQDYVAVTTVELALEDQPRRRDTRAERAQIEALALEIVAAEGRVTRAGLAVRAEVEDRVARKILGEMAEDGRLRRVGFGRGVAYYPPHAP